MPASSAAFFALRGDVTILVSESSCDEQMPRIIEDASTPTPINPSVLSLMTHLQARFFAERYGNRESQLNLPVLY
jgi:hypothetical protein